MLLSTTIKIKWNGRNKKKYIDLGYEFTKVGDYFDVKVEDLSIYSHDKVDVKCDICGKVFQKEWKHYLSGHNTIKKDLDVCKDCSKIKMKLGVEEKYGVSSTLLLKDVKEKSKVSMKKKYGVENVWESEEILQRRADTFKSIYGIDGEKHNEIQNKMTETMLQRYGVKSALQSPEILNKVYNTNLQRYGVKTYLLTEEIKEKTKSTSLKKYGTIHPSQSEEVKNKVKSTMMERYGVDNIFKTERSKKNWRMSLLNNDKCMSSTQQREICKIYNGILNYPIGKYFADIFLEDYNIIIEYDGSGHDISLRRNIVSKMQFDENERIRERYIVNQGYKIIRLISNNDSVYSKEIMISLLNNCIKIFNSSNTQILKINIDDYIKQETTE